MSTRERSTHKGARKTPYSSRQSSAASVDRDFSGALVFDLLSSLNTPRSLAVWMLYAHKEHDQLVKLTVDPLHYEYPEQFRDDFLATSLLSKCDSLATTFDRRQVALDKFLLMEEHCKAVNHRVIPFAPSGYENPSGLHPLIPRIVSKIERILGRFDAEEWIESCDWGPGVSTLLKGATSVKPNKYQQETGMTHEVHNVIWPLMHSAYPSLWSELLVNREPTCEPGNVVTTVKKNSKTDRVIAVEPGWNLWFQKGVGKMIRRRLSSNGCNLNDQGRNQEMSRNAYRLGLATIDLSSASDTVARELVRLLLPERWYQVLDLLRCKGGFITQGSKPEYRRWEKFSSMGNGFTFELESAIFYATALVCTEAVGADLNHVSVYGDDIILPTSAFSLLTELLDTMGFILNPSKSFSGGMFYESCGSYWFGGADVKPFYLDSEVINKVSEYYTIHNNIVDYAHRCYYSMGMDRRFRKVLKRIQHVVPTTYRNFVPRHLGDVGFWSNLDVGMAHPATKWVRQVGWRIRVCTERVISIPFDGYGLVFDRIRSASAPDGSISMCTGARFPSLKYISAMDGAQKALWRNRTKHLTTDAYNMVPLKSTTKTVTTHVVVGHGLWYDFGPWI